MSLSDAIKEINQRCEYAKKGYFTDDKKAMSGFKGYVTFTKKQTIVKMHIILQTLNGGYIEIKRISRNIYQLHKYYKDQYGIVEICNESVYVPNDYATVHNIVTCALLYAYWHNPFISTSKQYGIYSDFIDEIPNKITIPYPSDIQPWFYGEKN